MTTPKWKRFEELTAKIQKELTPDAAVTLDDKIAGKLSGTTRQIDISIRKIIGQFNILIVMDCKDHTKPVDVKDVEEFIGLVKDVGANKGAIVSAAGFTSSAKTRGENAGIDLYRLVDTQQHDWQVMASIPTLCEVVGIERYSPKFQVKTKEPFTFPQEHPAKYVLYDEANRPLGELVDLILLAWNEGRVPTEPGDHRDIDFIGKKTRIKCEERFVDLNVTASLRIKSNLYFGQLRVADLSGFHDQITGKTIANKITVTEIDIDKIEKEWRKIDSRDELAITPPSLQIRFRGIYV